jgi:hypothetical protein
MQAIFEVRRRLAETGHSRDELSDRKGGDYTVN